jgi:hypothetical protein
MTSLPDVGADGLSSQSPSIFSGRRLQAKRCQSSLTGRDLRYVVEGAAEAVARNSRIFRGGELTLAISGVPLLLPHEQNRSVNDGRGELLKGI